MPLKVGAAFEMYLFGASCVCFAVAQLIQFITQISAIYACHHAYPSSCLLFCFHNSISSRQYLFWLLPAEPSINIRPENKHHSRLHMQAPLSLCCISHWHKQDAGEMSCSLMNIHDMMPSTWQTQVTAAVLQTYRWRKPSRFTRKIWKNWLFLFWLHTNCYNKTEKINSS